MGIYTFNVIDDSILKTVNADTVHAYMYALDGAMGETGQIRYFCVKGNSIYIYDGNTRNPNISREVVQELQDQIYDIKDLFPRREWSCVELGYGNYLYMKPCYKDKFVERYDDEDEHIYLCYERILISLLQEDLKSNI